MKKLLVILALLITMSANAQWVKLDTITYGTSMTSIGDNLFVGTMTTPLIRYSSNGGSNWTNSTNSYYLAGSRGMVAIGNTLFAGTHYGIYSTTNFGTNWTLISSDTIMTLNMKLYNNSIISGGYHGLLISSNNGSNWSITNIDNKNVRGLFTTSTKVITGGRQLGGVYVSTNGGYNFTNIGLNDKYIVSVGLAGNTYIAGTDTAGIYTSTNEGVNWGKVNVPGYPNFGTTEIAVSGSNIFVASNIGCIVSNDYGVTWTLRNEGLVGFPIYFYIANGYLYSAGMGTYRRPLSELVGIQNISTEIPSSYSLGQNYPNPFNPTTNVKFSIIKAGDVKIVVYDIQGREVQTLVNERLNAGTYEVKFDGTMLTSGVYFYKMVSGGFTETKRMLLIK
jgi:Secretion system C-terminal sorting domain